MKRGSEGRKEEEGLNGGSAVARMGGGKGGKEGGGGMKKMGRHEGWKSSNEGENKDGRGRKRRRGTE